jgi:hypothetical protein
LVLYSGVGKIHSWPLPKRNGAQVPSGSVSSSTYPGTPSEMRIEWSISKCPGDVTYASLPEASFTLGTTVLKTCTKTSSVESAGLRWSNVGSFYECQVTPATGDWYVNYRIVGGCASGICPVVYLWN